jgi:hypothetical protein
MPNQIHGVLVHTMSGNELSRVRTELSKLLIVPFSSPHPVQPNRQLASHRHLRNALLPTHRQVDVPTFPIWIRTHRRLRCLHQQEPQQSAALLADVSQSLPARTGILLRESVPHSCRSACRMGTARESDDQHESQPCEESHTRMGHQPQHFGPFLRFLLNGCG